MKCLYSLLFIFVFTLVSAQDKQPLIFRWQDKSTKKNVARHIQHDTLIKTLQATIHISYSNSPDKPYLLLLHGMGHNGRSNWYNQIKSLSKTFNLIVPDLIYFGESTSSATDMSAEFQVNQLHEALSVLSLNTKLNIMGFSYGGLTAALYNELYHQDVNKLIIIDGPVKFFSGQMADSMAQSIGVKNMNQIIVPQDLKEFRAMQTAVLSGKIPAGKRIKLKIIRYFFLPSKELRINQLNYLIEHQLTYQSYNYNLDKTPTLLIWGGKDGVVPPSVGVNLNHAFPKTTTLIIYPKAKHDAHFSEAKHLNKTITKFILEDSGNITQKN